MGSWRRLQLGTLVTDLIDHRGKTPIKLGGKFQDAGVPVVSARNVKNGRVELEEDIRFISPEMYQRWMPVRLQPGDVVLTSEAPLGEVGFLSDPGDLVLSQRLFGLRANPKIIDPRYLYYSLRSPVVQQRLLARATGTTAQGIRQSELRRVEIDVPSMDEQRAVVETLSSIEALVENDLRLAEDLDALVRTSYRVQFGDILGGDEPLSDWMTVTNGVPYRSVDLTDDGTAALVSLKSIRRGGGYSAEGLKPYSGTYKPSQKLTAGDVVVARTDLTQAADVVGRPAWVPPDISGRLLLASMDLAIVRPKQDLLTGPFIYGLMTTPAWAQHARGHANGTTVLHLRSSAFSTGIRLPAKSDVDSFSHRAQAWLTLAEVSIAEAGRLESIRDVLLRTLLTPESDKAVA